MTDFGHCYECYMKAREKSMPIIWGIACLIAAPTTFPILWFALDFQSDSLLWTVIVKIVLIILFAYALRFVLGLVYGLLERKILKCCYKRIKGI